MTSSSSILSDATILDTQFRVTCKDFYVIEQCVKNYSNNNYTYKNLAYMVTFQLQAIYQNYKSDIITSLDVDPYTQNDVSSFFGKQNDQDGSLTQNGGTAPSGYMTDLNSWLRLIDPSVNIEYDINASLTDQKNYLKSIWNKYIPGFDPSDTNTWRTVDQNFVVANFVPTNPTTYPNFSNIGSGFPNVPFDANELVTYPYLPLLLPLKQDLINIINNKLKEERQDIKFNSKTSSHFLTNNSIPI
jgi:hypothetical protein